MQQARGGERLGEPGELDWVADRDQQRAASSHCGTASRTLPISTVVGLPAAVAMGIEKSAQQHASALTIATSVPAILREMEQLYAETLLEGIPFEVAKKGFRRADGSEVERQVVEHPGSVAIVAHDEECVYLVRQPREAVGDDGLLELPAGTMDVEGESELECAQRELSEEVDLRAERWRKLHTIYPSPGFLSETVTIFAATELSAAPGEGDEDEQIKIVRLPLAEVDSALPGSKTRRPWSA